MQWHHSTGHKKNQNCVLALNVLTPGMGNTDGDIKNEAKYKLNYSHHKTKQKSNKHVITTMWTMWTKMQNCGSGMGSGERTSVR